ncbi:MAG: metal ABC transporter solute-binding protein, Zn/Mn family [Thermoleophilia bacterium]
MTFITLHIRRLVTSALVTVAAFVITATPATGAQPTVVATTTILGDVARVIAGPDARVVTLMPVGADPHSWAPSARQAASARGARLLIANGSGLESGMRAFLGSVRDDGVPVLEVAPRAAPRPSPDGEPDPHFWTDPRRMELAARAIADALGDRLSPAAAARVTARATAYRAVLRREDRRIRASLRRVPVAKRVIVTNHHVLGHFAHRYRFRVVGAVIPSTSTLASPSAADLADLVRVIRREGVRAILVDSSSPRALADALADEADTPVRVETLFSESLGPRGSGAATYLGMLRVNTGRIIRAVR